MTQTAWYAYIHIRWLTGHNFMKAHSRPTILTTTTGKQRFTTKFHINIILKFRKFFFPPSHPFGSAWVYMYAAFSILSPSVCVTFYMPYGQRFIIIWFSSRFVSNLWFFVWFLCFLPRCIRFFNICFCCCW